MSIVLPGVLASSHVVATRPKLISRVRNNYGASASLPVAPKAGNTLLVFVRGSQEISSPTDLTLLVEGAYNGSSWRLLGKVSDGTEQIITLDGSNSIEYQEWANLAPLEFLVDHEGSHVSITRSIPTDQGKTWNPPSVAPDQDNAVVLVLLTTPAPFGPVTNNWANLSDTYNTGLILGAHKIVKDGTAVDTEISWSTAQNTVGGGVFVLRGVAENYDHLLPFALHPLPTPIAAGWAQTSQPFQQDSLVTDGAVQYAVWVDPDRIYHIGKRTHDTEDWEFFRLTDSPNDQLGRGANDSHNSASLGVDQDGYVHIFGNVHRNPIKYMRSTNPGDITSWEAPGMVGTEETSTTYPVFFRRGDGRLACLYREGTSWDGDSYINLYDENSKTWTRLCQLFSGTPDSINAYYWRIAVDPDSGVIHVFFTWRMGNGNNQHICYAKSTDGGATWQKSDGTPYSGAITYANSEVLIETDVNHWTVINSGGADVDINGYPHGGFHFTPVGGVAQLLHVWQDEEGWHDEFVTSFTQETGLTRPALVCWNNGDIWLTYTARINYKGWLRAVDVTVPGQPKERVLAAIDLDRGSPTYDGNLLHDEDKLHMLITRVYQDRYTTYSHSPAYVLEVERPGTQALDPPEPNTPPGYGYRTFWAGSKALVGAKNGQLISAVGSEDGSMVWPLRQGSIESRPTFVSSVPALNEKPAFAFNGVSSVLDCQLELGGSDPIPQPLTYVMVVNLNHGVNQRITDGTGASARQSIMTTEEAAWQLFSGTGVSSDPGLVSAGTYFLVAVFNGASSRLTANGVEVVTGDPGPDPITTWRWGKRNGSNAPYLDGDIAFGRVILGVITPSDEAALKTWAANEYGIEVS